MFAETLLFNNNENRFFLRESAAVRAQRKVCTLINPPLDHLEIINSLHRGRNISMVLTPQKPGTYFGSNVCRCVFLPPKKKLPKKPKEVDEPKEVEDECSEVSKKSLDDKEKKKVRLRKSSMKSDDDSQKNSELTEIKCMLRKLLNNQKQSVVEDCDFRKKSSLRIKVEPSPKPCPEPCPEFIADECRKCLQKICMRCRMFLDSCCCGIPNFLFCKDCDGKYRSPNCSNKDPFSCRMCDQKICLVCCQPIESCPCPKPNFLFCRMCDIRMRTRCCIPGVG